MNPTDVHSNGFPRRNRQVGRRLRIARRGHSEPPTLTPATSPPLTVAPPAATETSAPSGWVTTFELATEAPAGATTVQMEGEAEIPSYAPPTITVPSGTIVL
jgi:hypothetical protein